MSDNSDERREAGLNMQEDSFDPHYKIKNILSRTLPDPLRATEALIQSALNAGGEDNVSVIVISTLEAQDQILVPGVQFFAMPHSLHVPRA